MKLTVNSVLRDYVVEGKSDTDIAKKYGVCRTAVSKYRKYHGIFTRKGTGEIGERIVMQKLNQLGFQVEDMNAQLGKTHPFDLLINHSVRVDVKAAIQFIDQWRFALTNKQGMGIIESDHCKKLENGRTKKLLTRTCDFVILCAFVKFKSRFFIIPSIEIPDDLQTIGIRDGGKWSTREDRWDLLINASEEVMKKDGR